jgi:osmoprotectant transport system ATP-binding protein
VSQNIQTVPRLAGVPKKQAQARAAQLMETVGLDEELANRYPFQLSGGQQQRVGVARALAVDPNILLMDEPFGAVDPLVRRDLQREMLNLQKAVTKTILFVTHDIDEAFLLGDQVVILESGARIAQQGTPEEIISRPASDFVARFIGDTGSKRLLRPKTTNGVTVLVDSDGRIVGRLDGEGQ